jgi:hypothetical protein
MISSLWSAGVLLPLSRCKPWQDDSVGAEPWFILRAGQSNDQ